MNENQNLNNQNGNDINQVVNSIPPVSEVKIEEQVNTPPVNGTVDLTNKNDSVNKEQKNGKGSTILLILLFVFLFGYIMGMPYINEYINKLKSDNDLSQIEKDAIEEEKRQEQQNNKPVEVPKEEKTSELVCTFNFVFDLNYTLIQTQKFYYDSNNKIISSSNSYQYGFNVINDTYTNLKNQCDQDSLKYVTHDGYTMACSYDDTSINISHEFDLENFVPIVDGTTIIKANAGYGDNINTVKNSLISQGYSCK